MKISTKYSIGDEVYVIGTPPEGCQQPGCMDGGLDEGCSHWAILSVPREDGSLGPCTVSAVLVMEPNEEEYAAEDESADGALSDMPEYEVYYAVREAKGQFFPEELCFANVDEAGALVERLNVGNTPYPQ